jgi:hypothetical protein
MAAANLGTAGGQVKWETTGTCTTRSDPTGADGSTLIAGCPCSVDHWPCCPGGETSFSCDDGTWRLAQDGCMPVLCDYDGGARLCTDQPSLIQVTCVH